MGNTGIGFTDIAGAVLGGAAGAKGLGALKDKIFGPKGGGAAPPKAGITPKGGGFWEKLFGKSGASIADAAHGRPPIPTAAGAAGAAEAGAAGAAEAGAAGKAGGWFGKLGKFFKVGGQVASKVAAPLTVAMTMAENMDELQKTGAVNPLNQAIKAGGGLGKVFNTDEPLFSMSRLEGAGEAISGATGAVYGVGTQIGKAINDVIPDDISDQIVDGIVGLFGGETNADRAKKQKELEEKQAKEWEERKKIREAEKKRVEDEQKKLDEEKKASEEKKAAEEKIASEEEKRIAEERAILKEGQMTASAGNYAGAMSDTAGVNVANTSDVGGMKPTTESNSNPLEKYFKGNRLNPMDVDYKDTAALRKMYEQRNQVVTQMGNPALPNVTDEQLSKEQYLKQKKAKRITGEFEGSAPAPAAPAPAAKETTPVTSATTSTSSSVSGTLRGFDTSKLPKQFKDFKAEVEKEGTYGIGNWANEEARDRWNDYVMEEKKKAVQGSSMSRETKTGDFSMQMTGDELNRAREAYRAVQPEPKLEDFEKEGRPAQIAKGMFNAAKMKWDSAAMKAANTAQPVSTEPAQAPAEQAPSTSAAQRTTSSVSGTLRGFDTSKLPKQFKDFKEEVDKEGTYNVGNWANEEAKDRWNEYVMEEKKKAVQGSPITTEPTPVTSATTPNIVEATQKAAMAVQINQPKDQPIPVVMTDEKGTPLVNSVDRKEQANLLGGTKPGAPAATPPGAPGAPAATPPGAPGAPAATPPGAPAAQETPTRVPVEPGKIDRTKSTSTRSVSSTLEELGLTPELISSLAKEAGFDISVEEAKNSPDKVLAKLGGGVGSLLHQSEAYTHTPTAETPWRAMNTTQRSGRSGAGTETKRTNSQFGGQPTPIEQAKAKAAIQDVVAQSQAPAAPATPVTTQPSPGMGMAALNAKQMRQAWIDANPNHQGPVPTKFHIDRTGNISGQDETGKVVGNVSAGLGIGTGAPATQGAGTPIPASAVSGAIANPPTAPGQRTVAGSYTPTPEDAKYFKGDLSKLKGMDPVFVDKLKAASAEAGVALPLTSGFRSQEKQDQLRAAAVKKYGSEEAASKWVAKTSIHTTGNAADFSMGGDAEKFWGSNPELVKAMEKQGLHRPLSHEAWHWESDITKDQNRKGLAAKLIAQRDASLAAGTQPQTGQAPVAPTLAQTAQGVAAGVPAMLAAQGVPGASAAAGIAAAAPKVGQKLTKITEGMSLGDMLSVHESKGNYNIFNQGKAHKYKQGEKDFSKMTVNEVMAQQNLAKSDPNKLFAVGKYQIIPETMKAAAKAMGLKGDEKFTPELQDKIFNDYLVQKKQKSIGDFIKTGEGLDKAARASGAEWASVGVEEKGGKSLYGGVNKAFVSPEQMKKTLAETRQKYLQAKASGMSEQDAMRAATTGASGGGSETTPTAPAVADNTSAQQQLEEVATARGWVSPHPSATMTDQLSETSKEAVAKYYGDKPAVATPTTPTAPQVAAAPTTPTAPQASPTRVPVAAGKVDRKRSTSTRSVDSTLAELGLTPEMVKSATEAMGMGGKSVDDVLKIGGNEIASLLHQNEAYTHTPTAETPWRAMSTAQRGSSGGRGGRATETIRTNSKFGGQATVNEEGSRIIPNPIARNTVSGMTPPAAAVSTQAPTDISQLGPRAAQNYNLLNMPTVQASLDALQAGGAKIGSGLSAVDAIRQSGGLGPMMGGDLSGLVGKVAPELSSAVNGIQGVFNQSLAGVGGFARNFNQATGNALKGTGIPKAIESALDATGPLAGTAGGLLDSVGNAAGGLLDSVGNSAGGLLSSLMGGSSPLQATPNQGLGNALESAGWNDKMGEMQASASTQGAIMAQNSASRPSETRGPSERGSSIMDGQNTPIEVRNPESSIRRFTDMLVAYTFG